MKRQISSTPACILDVLHEQYKTVPLGVAYQTPFQLVVGVILSAQCTDERVNAVTATFFDRFRAAKDFLTLSQPELERMIRPTGFFRNKAKSILGAAHVIHTQYGGEIPHTMAQLVKIPGFGRKTANVILTQLHHLNEGVCVDTHVLRLSRRLGWTKHQDAIKVERDLMKRFPREQWDKVTHALIWHGRKVCFARKPKCADCVVAGMCLQVGVRSS